MALKTLGTNANNSLSALVFHGVNAAGSGALMRSLIKNDQVNTHPIYPFAYHDGMLFIPNRGVLKVLDGDYVGVDANGWPILVSKYSIATGGWTHS